MKQRHTSPAISPSSRPGRSASEWREEVIEWLRDAYGMERGLEGALEKQANSQEHSSQVRQRAAAHLEETRRHAERVRAALQSLNADTSSLKTGVGVLTQTAKGLGTKFARDERIKDLLEAYSMEHFEIACYTALSAAAEQAGLSQVVELCQLIIPEEESMAEALLESIPLEISEYLAQT